MVFMGRVLANDGIGPAEDKVKAIVDAREPQSASEVRSFLGLANYNARFIPDFATVAEPLRRLTKKGVRFEFGEEQRKAFNELKMRLSSAETLGGRKPSRPWRNPHPRAARQKKSNQLCKKES